MNERLKKYFDSLFEGAPDTKESQELKEEILRNTLDRYNDFLAQGKSEEASFTQAIARIGDVEELIALCNIDRTGSGAVYYSEEEIEKNKKIRNILLYISIALYFLSVLPPIATYEFHPAVGVAIMIIFIAAATGLALYSINMKIDAEKFSEIIDIIKSKKGDNFGKEEFEEKRRFDNILISSSVTSVIFSLTPISMYMFSKRHGNVAAIMTILFLIVAFGAAIFYKFNRLDTDVEYSITMVEEFKAWSRSKGNNKSKRSGRKLSPITIINIVITAVAVFMYFILGLKISNSDAWLILLLIFLLAFLLTKIVKYFFEYREIIKK